MAKTAKKTETVFIPAQYRDHEAQYVCVNGRRYLVKTGESVEVPPEVAEVIKNSIDAGKQADAFIKASVRR